MPPPGNLQRLIVKFVHPGQEFCPSKRASKDNAIWDDKSGLRLWNNLRNHKRKFLLSEGKYRKSPGRKDVKSLLTFWGEWEPQSRFRKLPHSSSRSNRLPHYVHKPLIEKGSTGSHNTDPFVFGTKFWFTNCQQGSKSCGRLLRQLDSGSLILFGTAYKGDFALDTVFVVGKRFKPADYLKKPAEYPKQLRWATLDHKNLARKYPSFVFYSGKRTDDGMPFSFVPCRTVNSTGAVEGHARVRLNCKKFGLPRNNQGCGTLGGRKNISAGGMSEDKVFEFWMKIADACCQQGFQLGHSIELPPIITARRKHTLDKERPLVSCL